MPKVYSTITYRERFPSIIGTTTEGTSKMWRMNGCLEHGGLLLCWSAITMITGNIKHTCRHLWHFKYLDYTKKWAASCESSVGVLEDPEAELLWCCVCDPDCLETYTCTVKYNANFYKWVEHSCSSRRYDIVFLLGSAEAFPQELFIYRSLNIHWPLHCVHLLQNVRCTVNNTGMQEQEGQWEVILNRLPVVEAETDKMLRYSTFSGSRFMKWSESLYGVNINIHTIVFLHVL